MKIGTTRQLYSIVQKGRDWISNPFIHGMGWMGFSQGSTLAMRLASNLILTRLLAPEAFGLLGVAMSVVTTLEWLSDIGLQPTLLRHPKGGDKEYLLQAWWIGLARGITLGIIGLLIAFPLSSFYNTPHLAIVIALVALRPILLAFRSPAMPTWRRSMNYRCVAIEELTTTATGLFLGLTIALFYPSVTALIVGTLGGALAAVAVSYYLTPMRPSWVYHPTICRELSQAGSKILFNTLLMGIWLNLDRLIGLGYLDVEAMGIYVLAGNLAAIAEGLCSRSCDVYYSRITQQTDDESALRHHERFTKNVALFFPLLLMVGVLSASTAIDILYDSRYTAAGLVLAILLIRLMPRVVSQCQFQYLLKQDRLMPSIASYILAFISLIALIPTFASTWGLAGLGAACVVSTCIQASTQALAAWKLESLNPWPIIVTSVGALALSCIAVILHVSV